MSLGYKSFSNKWHEIHHLRSLNEIEMKLCTFTPHTHTHTHAHAHTHTHTHVRTHTHIPAENVQLTFGAAELTLLTASSWTFLLRSSSISLSFCASSFWWSLVYFSRVDVISMIWRSHSNIASAFSFCTCAISPCSCSTYPRGQNVTNIKCQPS